MLYLIEKYIAQFPYRQIPELLRFKDCGANLHEMTLDEVNEVVSNWSPVLPETAENTKRKIAQYLEWVAEQGQTLAFDISKVKFPVKENTSEYVIYSTKDIQKYYNILYSAIERKAVANGTSGSTQIFRMTHAAGILAFYGLTDKQILNLDLSDVQADGVRGYDLPLTQEDISILLDYKNMHKHDNNNTLKGEKYIRNRSVTGQTTDSYFLNRPLSKIDVEEKYIYLRSLLKTSQLNLFGKFDRAYAEEKKHGEKIVMRGKTPQWFSDIFQASENWLTKRKKEFISYRDFRDENNRSTDNTNDKIMKQLNAINSQIAKLNQEAEELRKQLV